MIKSIKLTESDFYKFFLIISLLIIPSSSIYTQVIPGIKIVKETDTVRPLQKVMIICTKPGTLAVRDGKNIEYFRRPAATIQTINAGGSPGLQSVVLLDKKGKESEAASFFLAAKTNIEDGGRFGELFRLLYKGMLVYSPNGYEEVTWNGKSYHYFVPWVLDHNNVMSGMQYFRPDGHELIDLMRAVQREDGMIWSFVRAGDEAYDYYKTVYTPIGFFKEYSDAWFVRQPVENHPEYNYVNMFYKHWKASGDTAWMRATLESAAGALDYCITDSIRWSERFQLLKRPYCIDSWDFQVNDEYTPYAPVSPTMIVVPGETKYGIFFGDNTGYYEACMQLAEMYEFSGQSEQAAKYSSRAGKILERLIDLSWNGRYFTHFIDEDPAVKRNLGVDEKSQIAQGNMYSLNRGLPHDMNVAIIKTYLDLKKNLPEGSPGEWYAIYPPFAKGFGQHDALWQYMNGGVAGHAIGEMARGAYENGYENYASDVLLRALDLIKKGQNRLWFTYTGSIPTPPPPPVFRIVDISAQANMDLWDIGGKGAFKWMNTGRPGNDMRGLPTGEQIFNNIKFRVIDPEKNNRKAVIGLSYNPDFPRSIEVPVNDNAASVYLLHSSSDNTPSEFAGAVTFHYTDGTERSRNLVKFRDVTNWWFSKLENERAGVAWAGPNPVSTRVGVCWAVIDNPEPDKKIEKLIFHAPIEGGFYTVIGITLADRPHYVKPKLESYGGPDNWAAANGMAALVEGLAGVRNEGLAFSKVKLSPRWCSSGTDSVNVDITFPASGGYVSYKYSHDPVKKEIRLFLTGSGRELNAHLLLPATVTEVSSVSCDGAGIPFKVSSMEESRYADFHLEMKGVREVLIKYY